MSGNRLAQSASSYLRSAAPQPVAWHAWSGEAFERAREENKPILLDIGAVWCHWCHVMDHESYEDPRVAELINARYVAIKVDRDERPDVDARYQKAVQAMIGQGGWPLTVFLLPDGRPFYGGTYFPPRDMHGRPAFTRVLASVADAFAARPDEVQESAAQLHAHLARERPTQPGEVALDARLVHHALVHVREPFDAEWGGFGNAPKFPHAAAQDALAAAAARGDKDAAAVLAFTLERMRAGGVYDQLAGGFHRYSVDRQWLVPHFEKMLYDNAALLRDYSRAGAALARPDLTRVADEIAAWMRDVLAGDGAPGFGGSQDADTGPGDDGDHFTWSLEELQRAVGDASLAHVAALHLGVGAQGHMHHDPSRNVLHVAAEPEAIAAALDRPVEAVQAALEVAMGRLREARAKREAPFVDPIRYTNWNGMAIQALLEHAGRTDEATWDALALRALDAFLERAYAPGRGFARHLDSQRFGLLDDNAQMLDALLEAHLATGDRRHLDVAREVGDVLVERFPHPRGGFADRSAELAGDAEAVPLAQAERPIQDAPTASANGVALRALRRLADATGEARYRDACEAGLRALAPEAAHLGVFGGALLLALDEWAHPPPRVEVRGDASRWRPLVRRLAAPGATLVEGAEALPREGALVCLGARCLAPAHAEAELRARLEEARAA